jgi:hypothetical protein
MPPMSFTSLSPTFLSLPYSIAKLESDSFDDDSGLVVVGESCSFTYDSTCTILISIRFFLAISVCGILPQLLHSIEMPVRHYHHPHLFQYSHPWFHLHFFFIKYQMLLELEL